MTHTFDVPEITWTLGLEEGPVPRLFAATAARRSLSHERQLQFPIGTWRIEDLERLGARIEASCDMPGDGVLVVMRFGERTVAELSTYAGVARIRVADEHWTRAEEHCRTVADALRDTERVDDGRVPVHFWTMSEMGPRPLRLRIEAPTWAEIESNYAASIQQPLARMMQASPDLVEGLALWRGDPGTGKTTALRALAREWHQWCDVHVIVDPEVFLGERASYLMDVLFSFHDPFELAIPPMLLAGAGPATPPFFDADDEGAMMAAAGYGLTGSSGPLPPGASGHPGPGGPRAKLIVLEDAGELVSADARVSAGQALSRLLNMTDGMLGQGANVSVLVTTNEPIGALHPAIQRPGRCWAQVELPHVPASEANAWLAAHESDQRVEGPATIAELFALLRGTAIVELDDLAGQARHTGGA